MQITLSPQTYSSAKPASLNSGQTSQSAEKQPVAEASVPEDQITLSGSSDQEVRGSFLTANSGFLGSLVGTGIGIALAASSGAGGSTYFVNSVLGAVGGGIVGRHTLSDPKANAPLPGPLAGLKDNARNAGAVVGLGIGLGMAVTSGNITGGVLFSNSLLGAIGGGITGSIVANQ